MNKLIAVGLIFAVSALGCGFVMGVKAQTKYYEQNIIKKDIYDQFTDILLDALDDDGVVYFG